MRILFASAVLALITGCGSSSKPDAPTMAVPPALAKAAEGAKKSKDNEARVIADVQHDENGVLFPVAEEHVKKSAAEQLGTKIAAQATVKADGVEDFGDRKWKVTGTYHGPDRNGKVFTSHWTADIDVSFGGLQTKSVSLGKMEYDK